MRFFKLAVACCLLMPIGEAWAAEITHNALSDGNGTISIKGPIVSGDLERFRQISLRYPKAFVALSSDGGLIHPAIEIGKIIKVMGYTTVVGDDDVCASACALIWMAGDKRLLFTRGRIGFHAAYLNENGRLMESGVANALVGNYLTSLGASAKTVVFATTAPPDGMRWLTAVNRETAGIDFEIVAPAKRQAPASTSTPRPLAPSVTPNKAHPIPSPPPPIYIPQAPPPSLPNRDVSIISVKKLGRIQGEKHTWYKFQYLGLVLDRVLTGDYENGDRPEDDLKDFIDNQISESPWLMFSVSGSEIGYPIYYYINVRSINRENDIVSVWVKEDHKYNKKVLYIEELNLYNIYCNSDRISLLDSARYDKNGGTLISKKFTQETSYIIPDSVDYNLKETVCGDYYS